MAEDAIMEKKRSPNRLVVDEASNDDNSVVALSPAVPAIADGTQRIGVQG